VGRRRRRVAVPGWLPLGGVAVAASLVLSGASGCAWTGAEVDLGIPGVAAQWLNLSGLSDRETLVVTPDSVGPSSGRTPRPLVVVLPGLGNDAESMVKLSGWASAAHDHDLVVAVGQGVDDSFNAVGCCGTAAADGEDDVAYISQVIDDVSDSFPVDRDRVFLTGHSNGAMMTYRYLCDGAGRLAGAASVAGTNTAGCLPSAPVSFLQVSGSADTVVRIDGGESGVPVLGSLPSVRTSVADMAAGDGCPAPVVTERPPVSSERWTPCRAGTTIGFDILAGADHGYPTSPDYPATDRILAFWGLA
jgi:polyhydroxybutyrate depolymerase